MNLKILNLGVMVSISGTWTGSQKQVFLGVLEIAGMYPRVVEVHELCLRVQNEAKALSDARYNELSSALNTLDARHDDAIRSIYLGLTASACALRSLEPPRAVEADQLIEVRDIVLPEGQSYVLRSYREQAGNAARALQRLTPAIEQQLTAVPLLNGTMLDAVLRWGTLGQEIGDLENQRSAVAIRGEDTPSEYQARVAWAEVVDALLAVMDLSRAPKEAIDTLRQPVLDAVAAAESSKASSSSSAASTPEAAPEDPPDESVGDTAPEPSTG